MRRRSPKDHVITSALLSLCFIALACANQDKKLQWLSGSSHDKFRQLEEQQGGFSRTMIEVTYRYSELYWAGQDKNWGYAEHQVEHMEETIELGLQRRPQRVQSAQMIFPVLEELKKSIQAKDQQAFQRNFASLTKTCNACHIAENEPYIIVGPPSYRQTSIVPRQ